nr:MULTISPECIES: hypothetical protein [Nocardia]
MCADFGDELGAEAHGRVVGFHGVLDQRDVDVGGVAGAVLSVAAEEVRVFGATSVEGVLDDHAGGAACGSVAALAEQGAFEVVGVFASAFPGGAACVEDVLDAVEEVFVDEGFVAAFDLFTVVGDVAEVVPVPQHLGEFVDGDLFGGVFPGGPGTQAPVVEFVGQGVEGVVVGGEQFEGELHQWRSLGVGGDGADLAAVESVDHIAVAESGASDCASVTGFLAHFVGDVGPGFARLVFVEGGEDAVHKLADWCVVDAFGGRDEGDTAFAEICHDDGVVYPVACHAG